MPFRSLIAWHLLRLALCGCLWLVFDGAASHSVASGGSEPQTLFCIGTPDGYAAEFGLARDGGGYAAFSERFPAPVHFEVGKDSPTDWPYIHPSSRDQWAGGQPHTYTIQFPVPCSAEIPLYLVLGIVGAHDSEPSRIAVTVSGTELAPQTAPLGAMNVLQAPRERGEPKVIICDIPPGTLRQGDNWVTIRLEEGSWILYDYVALRNVAAPCEFQAAAPPDLAADFRAGPMSDVEEIVFAVRQRGKDGHWYANFGYYANNEVAESYFERHERNGQRVAYGEGGSSAACTWKPGISQRCWTIPVAAFAIPWSAMTRGRSCSRTDQEIAAITICTRSTATDPHCVS